MPIIPDVATVAFQVVNFLVLSVLLYYLLFRPIMRKAQARAAEREHLARKLAQEQAEATRLRAEWEARLARAEEEAAAIFTRVEERAEIDRLRLLHSAQAEAEHIMVEAYADARRSQQLASNEFREELLETVLEVSGSVIGKVLPPEMHDLLVQRLSDRIRELGRSEMQRVEAFRRALGDRIPTAHIATARPLSSEQQGALARIFTALADRHVNLELKTEPTLVAGVRVRLGDLMVDSSITGQLAELHDLVSRALKEHTQDGAAENPA